MNYRCFETARLCGAICIVVFFITGASVALAEPDSCSYSTYRWNVYETKAVDYQEIIKARDDLQPYEIDEETGCTVCREDQQLITIEPIAPFSVCKYFASDIKDSLEYLIAQGETIFSVVGYRVGMTRGEVDATGNRTGFSNHSFGIALDINPQQNGLYANCIEFGPECQLRMGGHWLPGESGSLTESGLVVQEFKAIGFKWGGEIAGQQKDFMHFSPSGY